METTGTNLQEVIDAVRVKLPTEKLSGKENQIVQLLRAATARCSRKTYDNLEFDYVPEILEGYFHEKLHSPTIELLALYVARDYVSWQYSILGDRKRFLGTTAFNKIPSDKERFDLLKSQIDFFNTEIEKFEMDFPDYSEDR